ncbi:MAG TPA: glucan 1,4-alpha-glucosidase [Pyrinomonadaceae bacterium]|nr:glucan 1,4-alpha-glucosidase [Pyrinomonadaceae bacterium]
MIMREAFGHPGGEPKWTSSSKEGIGTALADASPVWFTLAYGILNEIYYPRVDQANTRDAQYLVTDGRTFFHEEKRDLDHQLEYADERALAFRQTNSDRGGRYRIIKETITDPLAPVVLVHTRYVALQPAADDYQIYALLAPHLNNQGMNNSGRAATIDGRACLVAERAGTALAIVASIPFLKRSCGFVGASDGWTDLHQNSRMDWEFDSATDGNIALMGQLDHSENKEWTLAIGFGANVEEAARAAFGSLERGWSAARENYVNDWRAYCDGLLDLSAESGDGGRTYYTSAMVLRAHEDRQHKGALCASLSIPWGEIHGDQDIGGYHLVWPRDLCQSAGAALAIGDTQLPLRVLRYLASIQLPDGGMPQNCWVDGRPYWTGIQLDEVAFPIMLAWRLHSLGLLADFNPYPMVREAASYLIKRGPASPQERWEEEAGLSPSTLAAQIAALVCASELASAHNDERAASLCQRNADYWATNIERWTFTTSGTLDGRQEYYVRLDSLDPLTLESDDDPNTGVIQLNNVPSGETDFPVYDIIDGGFLELVRYGLRAATDEHVTKTLLVYDAILKSETPCGPCWHRYNHDGYGQKADGEAFDGTGVGRAWPLLTGERAHRELAAGNDVREYILAMECFANKGAMIPEQVWDTMDIPEKLMYFGRPTGSAMPLVWAHAEYVKLLRSARDGSIFDLIGPAHRRFVEQGVTSDLRAWLFNHKIRAARSDMRLRLETNDPARLHWTDNEWVSVHDDELQDEGLGIYAFEFAPGAFSVGDVLKFTFYWTGAGKWEGRDFNIAIE